MQGVELQAFTPQTLTSKAELRREIAKVRENGFAVDNEEFVPNLCCVSIPVRDHNGGASVAAISIAMPKMRFKKTLVPRWCEQMREKADADHAAARPGRDVSVLEPRRCSLSPDAPSLP